MAEENANTDSGFWSPVMFIVVLVPALAVIGGIFMIMIAGDPGAPKLDAVEMNRFSMVEEAPNAGADKHD